MNLNNLESTKNQFEQKKVEEQQQEAGGLVILHVESQGRQPLDLRYVPASCSLHGDVAKVFKALATVRDLVSRTCWERFWLCKPVQSALSCTWLVHAKQHIMVAHQPLLLECVQMVVCKTCRV
jgi:hypothetical protein